jgi:hypothetical protein
MLVLAAFLSICLAAVFFLLRFLLALNSEVKSEQMRPRANVELLSFRRAENAAQEIVLVHSRSRLVLRPIQVGPVLSYRDRQSPQYKGA